MIPSLHAAAILTTSQRIFAALMSMAKSNLVRTGSSNVESKEEIGAAMHGIQLNAMMSFQVRLNPKIRKYKRA
jgi:hypothetical protein